MIILTKDLKGNTAYQRVTLSALITRSALSAPRGSRFRKVNVVKGLKIYEDVFTTSELMKVADFINEIRQAGRNGELSGETFIFFNKQIKGNKREIIQLGVPLFQPTTEESNCHIEAIPLVLQAVIDHLVLWRLIPESRKPNSVIINFFDEFCQVGHLSMSKDLSVLVPQVTYTNQFTDEKLKFAIQLELPVAVVRQNTQSAQNEVFECYISVEAGASKVSHIKTCDTIKLIHMTSR
ncbi:hypothetical protein OsI_19904 [Oryza sativa Indica Group]|uniref:Uncharacterized protein n=1 Tax=Oryza sativa subsp. indica TaxID=39946 RepID=B8AY32_ORYSI|nr:hypothetical protein OsI_19904 [Oryza sativa Indica Group]